MNTVHLLRTLLLGLAFLPSLALAANIEVTLIDDLDGNLNGYCLDIVGGGNNIDPAGGLQAHTCYSYKGELGPDQAIDPDGIAQGEFKVVAFDVCASADNTSEGTKISLAECDGSEQQQFHFAENGNISPKSAMQLCFTAGQETRFGRNGTSPHQIKDLTLETCNPELAAYQQWRTREKDD